MTGWGLAFGPAPIPLPARKIALVAVKEPVRSGRSPLTFRPESIGGSAAIRKLTVMLADRRILSDCTVHERNVR
jgi:hypothetical protein